MNASNLSVDEYHKATGNDSVLVEEEPLHEAVSHDKGAILTYSGALFNPLKPNPDFIRIIDIAHALGNNCRYGGHCPRFYSVAEHSMYVQQLIKEAGRDPIECFAGLMHDSEEAYLPDFPTPIKRSFPSFIEAGITLRKVIFNKFMIPEELYPLVKDFDQEAYTHERKRLWNKGTWNTLKPREAKHKFLEKFRIYASMFIEGEYPYGEPRFTERFAGTSVQRQV